MSQERWSKIDEYICDHLLPPDPRLLSALAESERAGLPAINVAPNQGKFLELLARVQGARRILEVGTLGGYSTIWLARALGPGGRLISLELDEKHAAVARHNLAHAELDQVAEVRVGPALETLAALVRERLEPFDFVFIDADKKNIPEYFEFALQLSRPGALIIVDNVIRQGHVLDEHSSDPNIQGVRRFNDILAKLPGVQATALQTVGSKGHDGFALVLAPPR